MHWCTIVICVITLIAVEGAVQNVFEFGAKQTDEVESLLMQFLLKRTWKPRTIYHSQAHQFGTSRYLNLKDFKFKDCGGKYATVTSLSLTPDPLEFPGDITVSAKGVIRKVLDTPLSASVQMKKKSSSGEWEPIPCIAGVGSCKYQDVCTQLKTLITTCPDILTEHGIPCHCPFKPKAYSFPSTKFEVDGAFFIPGEYYLLGQVIHNGELAACLNVNVTIQP